MISPENSELLPTWFSSGSFQIGLPRVSTQKAKGTMKEVRFIIVDKITHLSEIAGPCSVAFVVWNVRLTGTLGRYQVRKATYR